MYYCFLGMKYANQLFKEVLNSGEGNPEIWNYSHQGVCWVADKTGNVCQCHLVENCVLPMTRSALNTSGLLKILTTLKNGSCRRGLSVSSWNAPLTVVMDYM